MGEGGERYSVSIGGSVEGGQVAAGKHIRQTSVVGAGAQALTDAEREELLAAFAALEARVAAEAPPEQRDAALERVGELEEAVTAAEPDLSTMEYVRRWFGKHLPGLAGSVVGLVVHPIVGKLVEAAGETVAAEFRRRFGPG
jgi:hypothetical protein